MRGGPAGLDWQVDPDEWFECVEVIVRGAFLSGGRTGNARPRLLESYGFQIPEERFVGPERAGSLCARLASGRYDALSGRFLGVDDDLEELLGRADDIAAREL